ncbi:MAG: hypothetical protein IPI56_10985 [Elusimicrobia bacterium]|nr:hypothetical protein [Elusimicrobiota bacterium]
MSPRDWLDLLILSLTSRAFWIFAGALMLPSFLLIGYYLLQFPPMRTSPRRFSLPAIMNGWLYRSLRQFRILNNLHQRKANRHFRNLHN